MNAKEAEAYIKRNLDGWFFSLQVMGGEAATPRVIANKVPKDFNPEYDRLPDSHEDAQEDGRRGGAPKARPFTLEEDNRLVELRQSGQRWQFIAAELKRATAIIRARYDILERERGLPFVKAKTGKLSQLTAEQKAQIVQLRAQGMTFQQINETMGVQGYVARDYYHRYQRYIREKRNAA